MPYFGFGFGDPEYTPTTSNFPASGFQQSAFADALTGDPASEYQRLFNMMTPGPATSSYLNYIQQVPTRQEYQPSTMQKIMSLISGAAYGLTGHPELGAKSGQEIQDYNFNRAMGDYLNKAKALAPGASIEEERQKEAASLLPQILKAQLEGKEFGVTSGQNQQKITNEATYQQGQLANAAERNRYEAEAAKARAMQESGMLGVAQQNAATAAGRLGLEKELSPIQQAEARARAGYYARQGQGGRGDTAAAMKIRLTSELESDPLVGKYLGRDSNGNLTGNVNGRIQDDKEAWQRFQEIKGKYTGLKGSPSPNPTPGVDELPAPYMDYLGQFYGNR